MKACDRLGGALSESSLRYSRMYWASIRLSDDIAGVSSAADRDLTVVGLGLGLGLGTRARYCPAVVPSKEGFMTQPADKKNRRRKIVLAIGVLLVAFVVAASGSTRRIRTEIEIDQSAEAVWAGGRQPGSEGSPQIVK